jgi:hypothetical protein
MGKAAPVVPVGERFGRLVVVEGGFKKWRKAAYRCRCDCGAESILAVSNLVSGNTRSCGCLSRDRKVERGRASAKHRMIKTPTYYSWSGMVQRCTNPKSKQWPDYGGRGITVCDRWLTFANFLADMGERPRGLSIDRINVNGSYEPGNCRWATAAEQAQNQRRTKLRREDVIAIRRGNRATAAAIAAARGIRPSYAYKLQRAEGAGTWVGAR